MDPKLGTSGTGIPSSPRQHHQYRPHHLPHHPPHHPSHLTIHLAFHLDATGRRKRACSTRQGVPQGHGGSLGRVQCKLSARPRNPEPRGNICASWYGHPALFPQSPKALLSRPDTDICIPGPRPRAINPPPRYEERVDAKSGWAHRLLSTLDSLSSWALFLASIIGAFVFRSFLEAFVDVIFDALEYHIAEYFRRRGYE